MGIIVQWVICGLLGVGALLLLLYRLGIFNNRPAGPESPCGGCTACSTAEKLAALMDREK